MLLSIDANTWTALGTWVLVIGTLIAVYIQKRQSMLINSANTIITFHDRFESKYMLIKRKNLAISILKKEEIISDEVLVFFETIGCLTRHKVLYKEMVWNEFAWEIIKYYHVLTVFDPELNYIKSFRNKETDETLYSDFQWLYNELLKIDSKKRNSDIEKIKPKNEELIEFLNSETNLIE